MRTNNASTRNRATGAVSTRTASAAAISRIGQFASVLLRRRGSALRLAGCFFSVFFATAFVFVLCRMQRGPNLIWFANGVLLSYLLLAPRWRWPAYLAAGYVAQMTGGLLVTHSLSMSLVLPVLGVAEAAIAALLLRRRSVQLPNFTSGLYLLRFGCYALLAAPAASGVIFGLIASNWFHLSWLPAFAAWVQVDALGIAVVTPACIAVLHARSMSKISWKRNWPFYALLALVAFFSFSHPLLPVGALIYPLLLLILLTGGLGRASFATLFVTGVGGWYTTRGAGMLPLASHPGGVSPILQLQLFIASAMFMLYAVSLVLDQQKATENRLQKLASLYTLITDNSRDAIIIADFRGNRTYVSITPALQVLVGWTSEQFIQQNSYAMLHPDDRERAGQMVRELFTGVENVLFECRVRRQPGDYLWVESVLSLVRHPATGVPTGILNIVRDISQRKQAELSREFHHSLNRAIHEVSLDGILVVNDTRRVVSMNKRFQEIWRLSTHPLGNDVSERFVGAADGALLAVALDRVKDPEAFQQRLRELYANPHVNEHSQIDLKDGRVLERYSTGLTSENGQYLGRVWFYRDITRQHQAEDRLRQAYRTVEALASTDALTGLANRRRFDQALATEWRRCLRDNRHISLLLIDVDLFKSYNDSYGHPAGDLCLKQIAESILDAVVRPADLVARFGGEEFAVILPNTDNHGAMVLARDVSDSIRNRKLQHSHNPNGIVTISVGCATLAPAFGMHLVQLLETADGALYQAKRNGRNQVCNGNETPAEQAKPADSDPLPIAAAKSA